MVACVSDAIASEIIEAGVVADGGMSERRRDVVTVVETRSHSISDPWMDRGDASQYGERVLRLRSQWNRWTIAGLRSTNATSQLRIG